MYNVNKRHSILFYATLLVLDDSGSGKWCASNQTLAKKKKKSLQRRVGCIIKSDENIICQLLAK